MPETVRSRFQKVMSGEMPEDRLPCLEWAHWWDQTIKRWRGEGLPAALELYDIKRHFGLDVNYQLWFGQWSRVPERLEHGGYINNEADYEALLPSLYPDPVPFDRELWRRWAQEQARGEVVCWISLSGFFWWPRVLLGIEPHLLAFYDQRDLMHRINEGQLAYMHRCLEQFCEVCTPDFMTFGEDMSYNHGPMIGKGLFDEFLTPYYHRIIPMIKQAGTHALVDSDGQVIDMIPWLLQAGLEGVYPLERQAGVDVAAMRAQYPRIILMGGYDKMVMNRGEAAMRAEFERLLPVMAQGGFLVSVDHQTPPGVSLAQYRQYLQLLQEYAHRAVAVR